MLAREYKVGCPWQPFHPVTCRPCSESQAIHRSRVNSERGQRWKAQHESRGGSAEVKRRPGIQGQAVWNEVNGPRWSEIPSRTPASQSTWLLTDLTPACIAGNFLFPSSQEGAHRPSPYHPPSLQLLWEEEDSYPGRLSLAGGVSPSPSISTRSLLASESAQEH